MHIIFQDDSILIVDKPAGLPVLPDGWQPGAPYLVKILEQQFGRIWIAHRLDKTTSGVMVFAFNAEAHRALNIQFEHHEVQKVYHALVNGVPAWAQKTAKFRLRTNVGHKHRTMVDHRLGISTETRLKVLERYSASAKVEARPMTGRTHQIRVHLYALDHPLIGDILYSAPATDLIARPALHAFEVTFTHPVTNSRVTYSAPYPEDFQSALEALRKQKALSATSR